MKSCKYKLSRAFNPLSRIYRRGGQQHEYSWRYNAPVVQWPFCQRHSTGQRRRWRHRAGRKWHLCRSRQHCQREWHLTRSQQLSSLHLTTHRHTWQHILHRCQSTSNCTRTAQPHVDNSNSTPDSPVSVSRHNEASVNISGSLCTASKRTKLDSVLPHSTSDL